MRLSRAAGYALHALAYLAREAGEVLSSTRAIAQATGIRDVFLLKSLKPLAARGILESVTGPRGGYRLTRPARKITILEVIEAVDGPLRSGSLAFGPETHAHVTRSIDHWLEKATAKSREVLARATLAQLAGKTR